MVLKWALRYSGQTTFCPPTQSDIRRTPKMAPARKEPDASTYAGRFAIRLRQLREKAGLTAQQAGEQLGVSDRTVYAWENATNAPSIWVYPKISVLYKLKKIKDILPNE
jgi:DNA-binding XRE family transcriptional regulator